MQCTTAAPADEHSGPPGVCSREKEIANGVASQLEPIRSLVRESGVWTFSVRGGRLFGRALCRRSGGKLYDAIGASPPAPFRREQLRRSRYVVSGQGSLWHVRKANCRLSEAFLSKAQALCAAIELAEKDGARGEAPEMLVRHEDDRYITEWVYG